MPPQLSGESLDYTPHPGGLSSAHALASIGPMRISVLSKEEFIGELIRQTYGERTHHVVTANAQLYVMAEQQKKFRKCVARADYVCADGISVVWACRLLAKRNISRITGVDLIPLLCAEAARLGLSVYLFGGRPGMASRTAEILKQSYPSLQVAGVACPSVGFERSPELLHQALAELVRARPAIIFVALGAPLQEYFIQQWIRPLGIPLAVGVGGSFEMIAGAFHRAPGWLQNAGLEWIFRWAQEPRRLAKRYILGNTLFVFYLLRHMIRSDRKIEPIS